MNLRQLLGINFAVLMQCNGASFSALHEAMTLRAWAEPTVEGRERVWLHLPSA